MNHTTRTNATAHGPGSPPSMSGHSMSGHSMSPARHLGGMLMAAGAVLGALLLFGVPAGAALRYAVLLACPLMMGWMMLSMSGSGHGSGHGSVDGSAGSHEDGTPRDQPGAPDGEDRPENRWHR